MKDYDKILGCLIGGAAGDALGYAIEFDREAGIFAKYGMEGIREYKLNSRRKAIISDDTQMTLFTAAGLLINPEPSVLSSIANSIYLSYLDWLDTQSHYPSMEEGYTWLNVIPDLCHPRAPGNTCLTALRSGQKGSIEHPLNHSKGCGGVMRVAPIGLFYDDKEDPILWINEIGAEACAITHGHPLGFIPGAGLVHIVCRLSHDPSMSLKAVVEEMIQTMDAMYGQRFPEDTAIFSSLMKQAMELSESDRPVLDAIHQLGEGWVGEEALAIAIYCALRFPDDFDAALCASVNHRGDSDSTGAICGNILGAYLGYSQIPDKFKKHLELTDVIEDMAKRIFLT